MTPENRTRVGEFLILSIYLIIDGYSLWPISHFWALTVGLVGLIALLLLDGNFSGRQIFTCTGVAFAGCVIAYFVAPSILPEETDMHGWLLPASDPTPQNSCGNREGLLVVAGRNAFLSTRSGQVMALVIGSCPVICMETSDGGVQIDADVFDEKGNLSARVQKNEFRLISGQYSYQERPDRSTLVAYDRQGKELLKIKYLNPKAIKIRGFFACKDSGPVVISDDSITLPGNRPESDSHMYENCNINSPIVIMSTRQPLPRGCQNRISVATDLRRFLPTPKTDRNDAACSSPFM